MNKINLKSTFIIVILSIVFVLCIDNIYAENISTEDITKTTNVTTSEKNKIDIYNQTYKYEFGEIKFETHNFGNEPNLTITIPIDPNGKVLEYIDSNSFYNVSNISNVSGKDINMAIIYNPNDTKSYYVIGKGMAYKDVSENIVEKKDINYSLSHDDTSIKLNISLKNPAELNPGLKYSFWICKLNEKPFNSLDDQKKVDKNLKNPNHFILPMGYYYMMNSDSVPYEEDYYFMQPASYVVSSFINTKDSKFSHIMADLVLSLANKNINESGYIPIPYQSKWLKKDYNLDKGYFDTRWNLDYAYLCLRMYDAYKDEKYLEMTDKILNYYRNYAKINNIEVKNSLGEVGYLVTDYSTGLHKVNTHSSLNHHLMGLKTLMYDSILRKNDTNYELISKMVKSLDITQTNWMKEDGDLHYARLLNNNYGLKDYPTLTLNDLKDCDELYSELFSSSSPSIKNLLNSKQKWLNEVYLPKLKKIEGNLSNQVTDKQESLEINIDK